MRSPIAGPRSSCDARRWTTSWRRFFLPAMRTWWSRRGAGANFGVATSFEFRLHPLEGPIFQGSVAFPVERAVEVAGHVREFVARHADVHIALAFTKDGDRPVFMVGATHSGNVDEAE